MSTLYPNAFSPISFLVTDLHHAVSFYTGVLGWRLILPPSAIDADAGQGGLHVAHLSTGGGVGVELHQFSGTVQPGSQLPHRGAAFLFCILDPAVDALAARIVAAGGKRAGPPLSSPPGLTAARLATLDDPFGNTLELYSHEDDPAYSAMPRKVDALPGLPAHYRAWTWIDGPEPSDLALQSAPGLPLLSGQVLVRNAVASLNPVDWKLLGYTDTTAAGSSVPGVDGAGTVVALGDGVAATWLGQRVAYHQDLNLAGSFAEYTPLDVAVLMKLPEQLDFATAASFPCPGLTAWQALEKLPRQPGQRVLVSGAGGAVGHYLVQLASARGFVVTVLCHPRHWDRLRALGATDCLAGPLAPDEAWSPAGAGRYFAVIDSVGAEHALLLAPAVRANGHMVCILGRLEKWPSAAFGLSLSLHEVALNALHLHGDPSDWAALTKGGEDMLMALAEGALQPEKLIVGNFLDLPQQLASLKDRQFSGKLLLRVEQD